MHGSHTFSKGKCWTPLSLENIEADDAVLVHVRMIDAGNKLDQGWFEWVVGRESHIHEEHAAFVGTSFLELIQLFPKLQGQL